MNGHALDDNSEHSRDSQYECYAYSSQEEKSSNGNSESGYQDKKASRKQSKERKVKTEASISEIKPKVLPEFHDKKYYMDKTDSFMKEIANVTAEEFD